MALTPVQRSILLAARAKGGTLAEHHHPDTADLLIASGLLTAHDSHNNGTWRLLATPRGADLAITTFKVEKPRLLGGRMPHPPLPGAPDGHEHLNVPEPERMDPSAKAIKRANDLGAKQRESSRRDLEAERQRRKNQRVERMFRDAA